MGGRGGYHLWDLANKKVLKSRDVIFSDNTFPFKTKLAQSPAESQPLEISHS